MKFKISFFFSPQDLASCLWRQNGRCWFPNQNPIQQVSFGFNTNLSSISRHSNKNLLRFTFSWYWETKDPKMGRRRHEILMKRMLAAIFDWNEISRMFWVFWQLLVQLKPLIFFLSRILQRVKISFSSPRSTWQVAIDAILENADFQSWSYPAVVFWFKY